MAARKIAISINEDLYEKVVRLAGEDQSSVSAWISQAAETRAANVELGDLVSAYEAEHGPITAEEVRQAHQPWQPRRRARAA